MGCTTVDGSRYMVAVSSVDISVKVPDFKRRLAVSVFGEKSYINS